MEKEASSLALTSSLQKLHLNKGDLKITNTLASYNRLPFEKSIYHLPSASNEMTQCPSLVNLCLGVLGTHFEDIIEDLSEITASFPPDIKMSMTAIARRRNLLKDEVLISLADISWEILDISGSEVSDFGLIGVLRRCGSLRAVDIRQCSRITSRGVSEVLSHCHLLETFRCGGCARSDGAVRKCLDMLKPKLNDDIAGESWEELIDDSKEMTSGANSLRWLLWPSIDKNSEQMLATECPRILVNPRPRPRKPAAPYSSSRLRASAQLPKEAIIETPLDELYIQGINPNTWADAAVAAVAVPTTTTTTTPTTTTEELPMAERFRLAFVERDERLAPKRAKNERQRRRRAAQREWTETTKALNLAFKSLHF